MGAAGRVEEDVDAQALDLRAAQRRLVEKTDAEPDFEIENCKL